MQRIIFLFYLFLLFLFYHDYHRHMRPQEGRLAKRRTVTDQSHFHWELLASTKL